MKISIRDIDYMSAMFDQIYDLCLEADDSNWPRIIDEIKEIAVRFT